MEIIQWARDYLVSNGYTIQHAPEQVQTTPWSNVSRFLTNKGYIYLKQTPPTLSLEASIIKILREDLDAAVPNVIAINANLNCFLMQDAGISLREYLKNSTSKQSLCEGLKKYTHIQRAAEKKVVAFLELGAPDWRLEKLPNLYFQFICNDSFLLEDGVTRDELNSLRERHSIFDTLCERLSEYQIVETIDHCDFHDNNILIDTNTRDITIIDWGETVITQPFFSLISYLNNAVNRYAVKETDTFYIELQGTCLEKWNSVLEKNDLIECFSLAKKLWPIYAALGFYRLTLSSHEKTFKINSGRIAKFLKEFIRMN
jgi:hypothetical protein